MDSLKGAAKRNWHKRMKVLMDTEPAKKWRIQDLWPEKSDKDIAEKLAEHFNKIARNFEQLDEKKIPRTYDCPIHDLTTAEVQVRLRTFRKPNSVVLADIPPLASHQVPC